MVLDPTPPPRYRVGNGDFEYVPLERRRLLLVGAPPGAGKTALVMQWVFDALRFDAELRVLVCNVEMAPEDLLTRELSRVSGVALDDIQDRSYLTNSKKAEQANLALDQIGTITDRIRFVKPPFTLEQVAKFDEDFDASIIILDYIQRIPATSEQSGDLRTQSNETMDLVRRFADHDKAIICISSVARDKDGHGKAYSNLGLGSFKESGEYEFGADCCYLLQPNGDNGEMMLKNPKSRHWRPRDIQLKFHRRCQRFVARGADGK